MNKINLNTIATDGKARVNDVVINGKSLQTPTFMPVATRGAIKSLPLNYLNKTNVLLANTYHLYLEPGEEVVKKAGGLGKFMNWSGPTMTLPSI